MAHKNLIDGTAYDTKGGRCLVDGTGYDIQKGRTLIDGTGYDIKFGDGLTWYLNDKLVSTVDVYVNFQSAGNPYVRMQCYQTQFGLRLSYSTSSGSSTLPYYDTAWQYGMDAYRTVTFDEPPTGTLLTWLQANAVQK